MLNNPFVGRKILGCMDSDLYSFWLVQHALLDSLAENNAVVLDKAVFASFSALIKILDSRIDESFSCSESEDECFVVSLSAPRK